MGTDVRPHGHGVDTVVGHGDSLPALFFLLCSWLSGSSSAIICYVYGLGWQAGPGIGQGTTVQLLNNRYQRNVFRRIKGITSHCWGYSAGNEEQERE